MKTSFALSLISAFVLTACATAVETRPAPEIAAKAYRSYDSYTGLEQTILPQISTFKWGENVRGSARLQTAETFEGQSNGAWLDIVFNYNTPSLDPSEMRVYNKVRWAGGEAAKVADFTAAVQTCSNKVTSYTDSYGYGGFGENGYYGRYRPHTGWGGDYRRRPGDRRPDKRDPRPDPKPDADSDDSDVRTYTDPYVRLGKFDPATRVEPYEHSPRRTVQSSAKSSTRSVSRPQAISRPAPISRPKPARKKVSKPVSRPKRPSNQKPVSRAKTSRKLNFMDDTTAKLVASASKTDVNSHRPAGLSRLSRRRFAYNYGYYGGIGRNYGYPSMDYVITSACLRREKLRVFVPKDRLLAAERYGLTVLIRANNGDERTLNITPNYVLAYQMATYSPQLAQRP